MIGFIAVISIKNRGSPAALGWGVRKLAPYKPRRRAPAKRAPKAGKSKPEPDGSSFVLVKCQGIGFNWLWHFRGGRMGKITFKPRPKVRNEDTVAKLRGLAGDLSPWEMRKIVERDATLKLILLLPETLLDQALLVGKALQACAESRRRTLEDQPEDYQT